MRETVVIALHEHEQFTLSYYVPPELFMIDLYLYKFKTNK